MDYFNTFSPIAKLSSFCLILAIAACNDWDADTFNFNGTYLNRELDDDEQINMKSPPGYDSEGELVKHLHKSLYGLKQAGHKWYNTLCRALADLGFRVNEADPGVFSAHEGDDTTILAIHVDDCLITGSSPQLISDYKQKLNKHYSLTDLGPFTGSLVSKSHAIMKHEPSPFPRPHISTPSYPVSHLVMRNPMLLQSHLAPVSAKPMLLQTTLKQPL
jgi:hypothetical protein